MLTYAPVPSIGGVFNPSRVASNSSVSASLQMHSLQALGGQPLLLESDEQEERAAEDADSVQVHPLTCAHVC